MGYEGLPNPRTMFVEGPFGAGKTTFAIETLIEWLQAGIAPERILVMVPQRTLARRYLLALRDARLGPLGDVQIRTLSGLAQDAVRLYWPLIASEAGFHQPEREPRFLTIETAQYAMSGFVEEAVSQGKFDAISVSSQQIARQVIDNLGKAAIMRIPYTEIPARLAGAWGSERPRRRLLAYEAAGQVAQEYRSYCMAEPPSGERGFPPRFPGQVDASDRRAYRGRKPARAGPDRRMAAGAGWCAADL
jgi:hypothetical protein